MGEAKRRRAELKDSLCAYCGARPAEEWDHIIARQLFSSAGKFRDRLPTAPSCGICNREKSKLEDLIGLFLPLSSSDPSSTDVVRARFPGTLRKNRYLYRQLADSLKTVFMGAPTGEVVETGVIYLDPDAQCKFRSWASMVIRGLYRFYTGDVIPEPRLHLYFVGDKTIAGFFLHLLSLDATKRDDSWASDLLCTWYRKSNDSSVCVLCVSILGFEYAGITFSEADEKMMRFPKWEWKVEEH